MTDRTSFSRVKRVGLLVVHGIGVQKRFETAAALARALAGTLAARDKPPRFLLIDRTGQRSEKELALPSPNPGDSPFEIVVTHADGAQTHIHIHEVWWADLGVSDGFWEQFQFWVWALGQWGARSERVTHYAGGASNTDMLMVGPKFEDQKTTADYAPTYSVRWVRGLLFLWGVAAFLTMNSWNVVKQVVNWISSYIGSPSLITEYVGHVRTYTQSPPVGGGSLTDLGQPWRATIRRRMIVELVAMAERGYECWYLLGHSQGAVLAFNAVQETEWCLPNYLQPEQAQRLRGTALWTRSPYVPDAARPRKPRLDHMMPRRPIGLADDEGISRQHLFEHFRGLLTYGAPLDKFATLWPRIVSLNKQREVFATGADWVNLWDAADPIGASLKAFSDPDTASPAGGPVNIHVRASPIFLYSHICYLRPEDAGARHDTNALLDVVLPTSGDPPPLRQAFAKIPGHGDAQSLRLAFARLQALLLGVLLALGAGLLAYAAKGLVSATADKLPDAAKKAWDAAGAAVASLFGCDYCGAVAFVVVAAIVVVGACGLYRMFYERQNAAAPVSGR